jgi:hypothetical protein
MAVIIVIDTPVDEQIGCWNVLKKQCKEVECVAVRKYEVKYIML